MLVWPEPAPLNSAKQKSSSSSKVDSFNRESAFARIDTAHKIGLAKGNIQPDERYMTDIALAISSVNNRIAKAAAKAKRDTNEIVLVAVSKTVDAQKAREAIDAGVINLGESRVQEAKKKYSVIGAKARFHLIGPLQTNKAKNCPGLFSLIHSIDRLELLTELDRRAINAGMVIDGLLQVNMKGETQKSGCKPADAAHLLKESSWMRGVSIKGLMTIPPRDPDPEASRQVYRELFNLKKELETIGIENVSLSEVSAGMSGDFEIAIEEGATIVRVGTAIFGKRDLY